MVRFRDDVDGCGCLRCQGVDSDVLRRSGPGVVAWSTRLVFERPSILLVLFAVAPVQLLSLVDSGAVVVAGAFVGVLGVFLGRGYVAVTGRARLGDRTVSGVDALGTVLRRLPAFVGALAVLSAGLVALAVLIRVVLTPALQAALGPVGVDPGLVDLVSLLVIAGSLLYAVVKFCVLPEACFVGGYGPVRSLRVTWEITSLQTARAVVIVAGFAALLSLGVLLDTRLAGPTTPVALSFSYGQTTVVLRSFGFSLASGLRFVFDVVVTAVYSGVFLHQYVAGVFHRESSDVGDDVE
ncbi:MAG: hypothetical protein ABEH61_00705 [Haloarculaceae archaeon]